MIVFAAATGLRPANAPGQPAPTVETIFDAWKEIE
jgi:hypothetical protein